MKYEVEIDAEIPEGYEIVRYGTPKKGDYCLSAHSGIIEAEGDYALYYLILRKKKWVPKEGEEYWYVLPTGDIDSSINWDCNWDRRYVEFGNCFQSEEKAQIASDALTEFYERFHE